MPTILEPMNALPHRAEPTTLLGCGARLGAVILCLALGACATGPTGTTGTTPATGGLAGGGGTEDLTRNSAECEAARLPAPPPMPVSDIPDTVLHSRQNGWATVRYDVVDGKPRNLRVVSSSPPGLYDPYALKHANRYSDPGGGSARGCIMTVNIRY